MKYLFDLTSLADNFSGIERYALCISSEFIRQFSMHEYILMFKGEIHEAYREIAEMKNVKCIVLPRTNKLLFNQIILPMHLYRQKADAYVFLAFPDPVLFFRKNVYTAIHDTCCWDCGETMATMSKWYFRISQLHSMRFCKKIITISEFSRGRIQKIGHVPQQTIDILYCGTGEQFTPQPEVNETVRERYGLPDEYLLTLSTLEPRKNLTLLLDAYEQLTAEGKKLPPLVLAGRKGWKMENLLEKYSQKTKDNLVFTGFVDDADLPAVYSGAKWFVFPTKYEGFGIPPLEAMACGTPVISSDSTSLPEVLGDAALYFESENLEALKKCLLGALEMPAADYDRMKGPGEARAADFSWTREAKKLNRLFGQT